MGGARSLWGSLLMKVNPMPDHAYLVSQIDYSLETGVFTWKVRRKGRFQGEPVGSLQKNGYLLITIDGVRYFGHRLAWYWVTGEEPECVIDHRDGDRANNRFGNLRLGDQGFNMQNQRKARSNNATGYLGVAVHAGGFTAQISVRGKKRHIGIFRTPEEAHAAYLHEKRIVHEGCTI